MGVKGMNKRLLKLKQVCKLIIIVFMLTSCNIGRKPIINNGTLSTKINILNRGKLKLLTYDGEFNRLVYSVSNGVVHTITNQSITITNSKGLSYIYTSVNPTLRVGDSVSMGNQIGVLENDLLFLKIKKDGQYINPCLYIDCNKG